MNTVYLSICQGPVQVLSFVSYSFLNTGLFSPQLDLFLGILFLFDAIIIVIFPLISLSDSSLLVCRKARDLCILILYPATLPNSLMSSKQLFGGIFRIFCAQYHVISKQQQFYFFLSNLDSSYFFFFLWLRLPISC